MYTTSEIAAPSDSAMLIGMARNDLGAKSAKIKAVEV
jgi:hypothetical protein